MQRYSANNEKEPGLRKTIMDDFRKGGFGSDISHDFRDAREFYLSGERKQRLRGMKPPKRFIYTTLWMFKSLFLRLNSTRRIITIASLVLFFFGSTGAGGTVNASRFLSASLVLILFVLMLELKDKIVAKDELMEGRAVQYSMMPDEEPVIPGWKIWMYSEPANDVGGDLLDFMKVHDSRFSLSIGDVSNKGLSAALFMVKLQSTIRALADDFSDLGKLGERVNEIFYRDSTPQLFASMAYLELQPESGEIRFFNAGHLPPVIISRGEVNTLQKGSAALGLMKKNPVKESREELLPGDIMVIYTDGITEARNEFGKFFGDDRLKKLLSKISDREPREMGKAILRNLSIFRGDSGIYDDLSMIILKRTPDRKDYADSNDFSSITDN